MNGNLIDMGPGPAPQSTATGAPGQPSAPAIEKTLPPGGHENANVPNKSNLVDLSEGMQKLDFHGGQAQKAREQPNVSSRPLSLKRMDSETQNIDEFHDAET